MMENIYIKMIAYKKDNVHQVLMRIQTIINVIFVKIHVKIAKKTIHKFALVVKAIFIYWNL